MSSRTRLFVSVSICFALWFAATEASAQVTLHPVFPDLSFESPVDIQDPHDGTDRLFVVEQDGVIYVVQGDGPDATRRVFLDISDQVHRSGEEGLLGLAFHPDYETNGRFFVYYSVHEPRASVVSSFSVSDADPDQGDRSSERIVLRIDQPQQHAEHKAGQLRFGPDGYLYIAVGDGGGFGEERGTGEDLTTLLGSILRVNVDDFQGLNFYAVPPDNPFAGNSSGYREEIYAYGFRNPWRFSFDRADFEEPGSGGPAVIWLGDVGSGSYEEVNRVEKGESYGWQAVEGIECHPLSSPCDTSTRTDPLHFYGHDVGRAIIGGFVYRGADMPWLDGRYIYGDFSSGRIWSLHVVNKDSLTNEEIVHADSLRLYTFGEADGGELYVAAVGGSNGGGIYRLAPAQINPHAEGADVPALFEVHGNHPNPFLDATTIAYTMRQAAAVELRIYDALGREVRTLASGLMPPGRGEVTWDGRDAAGEVVPAGIYFYRMSAGNGTSSGTMVRLR